MRRVAVCALAAGFLAACGGGDATSTSTTPSASDAVETTATSSVSTSTTPVTTVSDTAAGSLPSVPAGPRVVALGEEFLLADLLALGVVPVASTATVAEAGFQGLDGVDTSGIEVLPATEPNLERLAALRPDRIVTTAFFADELGIDRLEALAETIVLDDDLTAEEQLAELGAAFDRAEEAAALADELEQARAELRAEVEGSGCVVSVATIYPGPSVAAWVDGTSDLPGAIVDSGCRLVPDASAAAPDDNGRAFLSLEQLGLLSAPRMLLLQSGLVEGEDDAVAQLASDPLWTGLPAVAAGQVTTLDRLGYPGTTGELRLLAELSTILPE